MNSLNEKGHTKLKFTIASFAVHCLLMLGFILKGSFEPVLWATVLASFNATIAIYTTAKTIKDKVLIENNK